MLKYFLSKIFLLLLSTQLYSVPLILIVSSIFRASDIEILFEEEEDLYVNGYPNELAQAMLSILNNAKDAFMQNDIFNRKVLIILTQKNKQVIIAIEDNAGGIPTNIMNKIFEPYFSTKKQLNGTGIGLYMSKMIIEKHMDGSLLVENSKKGATFTIVLLVK